VVLLVSPPVISISSLQGDEIAEECTYNTATRKGITQLGLSVDQALKLDLGFNYFDSSHYNEPGLLLFLLPASTDVHINVSR
jgi:hypothetical protein